MLAHPLMSSMETTSQPFGTASLLSIVEERLLFDMGSISIN